MRRSILPLVTTISVLLLAACGGSAEDNKVAETRMDDLDSLKGTISDDMINTDEATDEAPLEAAPATAATLSKTDGAKSTPDPAAAEQTAGPDIVKIEVEPATE